MLFWFLIYFVLWNVPSIVFRISLVLGNQGKTTICLNLVKNFCGSGFEFDQIEAEVNQIKATTMTVKIKGEQKTN